MEIGTVGVVVLHSEILVHPNPLLQTSSNNVGEVMVDLKVK